MTSAIFPIATVREAKAHFSAILEKAQAGEATIITSRGRIVARIMPPDLTNQGEVDISTALEAAVQSGFCEAPEKPWKARPGKSNPVITTDGFSIVKAVVDMRR